MLCALLGSLLIPSSSAAQHELRDAPGGIATDRIIVRFAPRVLEQSTLRNPRGKAMGDANAVAHEPPAAASAGLRTTWNRWNVHRMRRVFRHAFRNAQAASALGLDRTFVLEVPQGTDTRAVAAAFAAFGDQVEYAEPDGVGTVAGQLIPNDTNFDVQWGMHNVGQSNGVVDADIDAVEAWALHTGETGNVTVAVIDSGVDPHAEFIDRMVPGINTANDADPNDTLDDCRHGTHVAGIIAAKGNNAAGVAGVSWGAKIMPVRVLAGFDPCSGFESDAAEGIVWAVDNGADVINISLQFCNGTQELEDAVNYAQSQGVPVISAAGNNSFCGSPSIVAFPARFANSMAISAINRFDTLASFSNFGNELDVCAPGDRIYSTYPAPFNYTYLNGTSMATPHVSGLAALMKSYAPHLTGDQIRAVISETAVDLGPEGWDIHFGFGRINAYNALLAIGPPRIAASNPPDGSIDARQPSEPDGSDPQGWSTVELTFVGDLSNLTAEGFEITQQGGVAGVPSVIALEPVAGEENVRRLVLGGQIPLRAWTIITLVESGTSVRIGSLPGDVNGDGIATPFDVLTLIDAVNGKIALPDWSTDIDRSGKLAPNDILREIDLLNGAGAFQSYLRATLP